MNRRQFSRAAAGLVTLAVGSAAAEDPRDAARQQSAPKPTRAEPVDAPFVDPAPAAAAAPEPRHAAIARAFADCAAAAEACIATCQRLLASGDESLGDCLKAVLDADAIATAVARLAHYDSAWAPVVAKQAIAILDVCIEACRPHLARHPACKTCSDACKIAIAKARPA
ncbi:hypothetical protein [Nevskia sp.]|uniref:hypothetical protein n=1 Tax=Nevskia sp. TaxID=1929292 RepID=UPI0025F419D1|nr:hypothetical protein [Nevskia sp.]